MYKKIFTIFVLLQISACELLSLDALVQNKEVVTKTNKVMKKTQSSIDKLDDESEMMLAQYDVASKELENYTIYNKQLKDIVASQILEMESISKQNRDIAITKRRIMPMIEKMIDVLEEFVKNDRPFLLKEREQRVASLRANMKRADISISAKYRQILESYQIEIDYGKTIETYDGDVESKRVHFLKVGRVGFYYQTRDKAQTAVWSTKKRAWEMLEEDSYNLAISKAIKIASKQRTPELFCIAVEQAQERR